MAQQPDPLIIHILQMGPLRPYAGTTPGKQHLRGRNVQTVVGNLRPAGNTERAESHKREQDHVMIRDDERRTTTRRLKTSSVYFEFNCVNRSCNWAYFHTVVSYQYEDATALVQRLMAREQNNVLLLPANIDNAPLRLVAPLVAVTECSRPCGNPSCHTARGTRICGNTQCIEHKCQLCCRNAAADARGAQRGRDACRSHGIDLVLDPIYAAHPKPALPPIQPIPAPNPPRTPNQNHTQPTSLCGI
ncbi:hypothetical protein C8J57DRAFT_1246789 [Mycena rebaudengoi]|nr:hypothetical protein C8J57DRAFT_1246789 [Mycena rebaudengoi]